MSSHAVACPQCHAALRTSRPLPDDRTVRCPHCGTFFSASTAAARPAPEGVIGAERSPPGKPGRVSPVVVLFGVAAVAASLLAGGAVALVLLLGRDRAPAPRDEGQERLALQLAQEKQKLDEERAKLDEEKRRLDFGGLLKRGDEALAKKEYAEAEKAYAEALKLFPADADALKGLVAAKAALASASTSKEDAEKKRADVARLVKEGKAAMEAKQFALAVRLFDSARQLGPADSEVIKALTEAQAAADADKEQKQKLAEYQTHMDAGRTALAAQRYADAIREFQTAQRLIPGDVQAGLNLRVAEQRLNVLQAAAQDQQQRVAAFAALMDRCANALRAKRYEDAVQAASEALKLFPNDARARQALADARSALRAARSQYNQLLTDADAALQARRINDAIRLYQQAAELFPEDDAARKGLRQAQAAVDMIRDASVAYNRLMATGATAMQARRFADAVLAYTEALRLVPGDPLAAQGLRDAQAAVDRLARRKLALDRQLQAGATALKQKQYAEAIRAFKAVLEIDPDNPDALEGLRQARYADAMTEGYRALNAKRRQDAIRFFEAALKEKPGDPQATTALQQAKIVKR
jgi:tetratricopeptide (TPR) repeat protein